MWASLLFVGGALQILGVSLLLVGLDQTRSSIDPDWNGLWPEIRLWFRTTPRTLGELASRAWNRMRGRGRDAAATPQSLRGTVHSPKPTFPEGDVSLESMTTTEALEYLRRLVLTTREDLRARISEAEEQGQEALAAETAAREDADMNIRADLSHLALGGLAKEGWGALLIIAGLIISTIAGTAAAI